MPALTINLTHDVDRVRKTYQYLTHDLRWGRLGNLRGLWADEDPYWMIPSLMALEDRHGVRSTFFFLEESLRPRLTRPRSWVLGTGRYRFRDEPVASAIRRLAAEGWEVGLHGSYESYRSLELLQREKASLEAVLGAPVIGTRQHYLNLDVPETWRLHRRAGLVYDASFGHKRGVGWRDGRKQPFTDEASGMVVIPLPLMECNVLGPGRDPEEAWRRCAGLMDEAEREGALLSVLWHQRVFNAREFPGWGEVYERLIAEGKRRGAEFVTCGELYRRHTGAAALASSPTPA